MCEGPKLIDPKQLVFLFLANAPLYLKELVRVEITREIEHRILPGVISRIKNNFNENWHQLIEEAKNKAVSLAIHPVRQHLDWLASQLQGRQDAPAD